jgi:hypothetical protein
MPMTEKQMPYDFPSEILLEAGQMTERSVPSTQILTKD